MLNGNTIRIDADALGRSIAHARAIAAELGSSDAESSLAAYWSVESRVRQWQQLIDRLGAARISQAKIVEIGSGLGLFTLVGTALGFRVVGIESSSDRYVSSLRIAQRLAIANDLPAAFIQAPSEALPLADASADIVVSFQTFEHVTDLSRTIAEIRRVLKPGGVLFAQAPNYASFYEAHYGVFVPLALGKARVRSYLRALGRPANFLEHLQWINPRSIRELLYTHGFKSAEVGRISTPPVVGHAFDTALESVPFRFRRGRVTQRLAYGLARLAEVTGYNGDLYPQLEVWATA